jgi:cellulose biosynthesis protein BcsQ
MKTLAVFNTSAAGKTSLVYHLGFMFAELGHRVLLADLDPRANLSRLCLTEERLEAISTLKPRPTAFGAVEPLRRGAGDVQTVTAESVAGRVSLLVGDVQLAELEDDLSTQWSKCLAGDAQAFRVTAAPCRVVESAASTSGAALVLLDVGSNLGALNRAALLAADHVVVPVTPDLFSLQALENVGPKLASWRDEWRERKSRAPRLELELPGGGMQALGYVVSRHTGLSSRGVAVAFQRWVDRMPAAYRQSCSEPAPEGVLDVGSDEFCLGSAEGLSLADTHGAGSEEAALPLEAGRRRDRRAPRRRARRVRGFRAVGLAHPRTDGDCELGSDAALI